MTTTPPTSQTLMPSTPSRRTTLRVRVLQGVAFVPLCAALSWIGTTTSSTDLPTMFTFIGAGVIALGVVTKGGV